MVRLYNVDCLEYMRNLPDKAFDLAIVDPPYGIGEDGASNHSRGQLASPKMYAAKGWDKAPEGRFFFEELRRVSANQIVWGANHFIENIPQANASCWIVWDKLNSGDFADCELAWTSFRTAVRKFAWRWNGMLQQDMKNKEIRIHPTQKPVALYKWLLKHYAQPGQRILDTHLGSGSIAIACHDMGFELVGCELDADYYNAACKRLADHQSQLSLL